MERTVLFSLAEPMADSTSAPGTPSAEGGSSFRILLQSSRL